jgi:hypothetical protein
VIVGQNIALHGIGALPAAERWRPVDLANVPAAKITRQQSVSIKTAATTVKAALHA